MGKKVYLAGPDVFFQNAEEIARAQKHYCSHHNLIGLAPLDNELPKTDSKLEMAQAIVRGNIQMLNDCDFVMANLANFRGNDEMPSCDSGTAWECGYATGLHKPVLAYTDGVRSIPETLRKSLDYCIIGNFIDALVFGCNFELNSTDKPIPEYTQPICLDPEHPSIYDADAYGAFRLGYAFAKGIDAAYSISDQRNLIEKYGTVDRNGAKFEDFDAPVNIMISVNHELV
jgi:nucleoside 2-deoxyribosyltransferase